MMSIQQREISKFLSLLNGMNAQYKIIIPDDGSQIEYGDLPVAKQEQHTRVRRGDCLRIYKTIMQDLQVGAVAAVPIGNLPAESIRNSLYNWATKTWGVGSITTMLNHDSNTLEVLRNF